MNHFRQRLLIGMMVTYVSIFSIWSALSPAQFVSLSERRALKTHPALNLQALSTGQFMSGFEVYLQDQFPLRETFRHLKSRVILDLFHQSDHHGIYVTDGMAAKLEAPLDPARLHQTAGTFHALMTDQLKASHGKIWFGLIPDKSTYLAAQAGVPSGDHDLLAELLANELPQSVILDLKDQLSPERFYPTDIHWRQETLTSLAGYLAAQMSRVLPDTYQIETLNRPFFGAYQNQAALAMPPDTIRYLTNPVITAMQVFDHEAGRWRGVYDPAAAEGPDPYSFFLSGPKPLLTLENPKSHYDRELVVFRDSFASSLIPLLAQCYARTTLIDIRYIAPSRLDQFVSFHGQDVLFLYSAQTLKEGTFLR